MKAKFVFILFLLLYLGSVSAESLSYTFTGGKLTGTETLAATGYVELSFENGSDQPYDLIFDRLKEGKTQADLKEAIDAVVAAFARPESLPEAFRAYAETVDAVGGVSAAPGGSARAGLLLEPGHYAVSPTCGECPPSADDSLVLNVTEGKRTAAPTPDLTIELSEFHFGGLPGELSAGAHLWEMSNIGRQGHFLGLFKLAEGKTQDDFLTWMASAGPQGPSGPPPGEMAGGSAFITGGQRYYYPLELTAGSYVAFCPVQDTTSGKPHDMLGMTQTFTVQ